VMRKQTRNSGTQSMATVLLIAVAATAVSLPKPLLADSEVYRKTVQSTSWIIAKTKDGISSGSGVLIDREQRLVITNFHVVGDAREATVFFPSRKEGKLIAKRDYYIENVKKIGLKSKVIAVDRKRDLALIELPSVPKGIPAIEIETQSVGPGDIVHSLGNPSSSGVLWAYTSGTVRAVYRKKFRTGAGEHDFTVVETQSPINSGDSGGPVVNTEGKLIAISQALAPKARLVSYCVDLSEIKAFLAGDWKPAPLPVSEVLSRAGLQFKQEKNGTCAVDFKIDKDATQPVFVSNETEYYGKADIRRIWTVAAKLTNVSSTTTTLALLQENARTKMGAWSIETTKKKHFLVVFSVKIDASANPEAMKSSMEYAANVTAAMASRLIGSQSVARTGNENSANPPQNSVSRVPSTKRNWLGY